MDATTYILKKLNAIENTFCLVGGDMDKVFKSLKSLRGSTICLSLGGFGLLYLISKCAGKCYKLEAELNDIRSAEKLKECVDNLNETLKNEEEPKGE